MASNSTLDWKAVIIRVICHSSAETEVCAGCFLNKREVHLRNMFREAGIDIVGKFLNFIDSTAAQELSQKNGITKCTSHFLRWQHYMRWMVVHFYSLLIFVFTHEQLADLLTKQLDEATMHRVEELQLASPEVL